MFVSDLFVTSDIKGAGKNYYSFREFLKTFLLFKTMPIHARVDK